MSRYFIPLTLRLGSGSLLCLLLAIELGPGGLTTTLLTKTITIERERAEMESKRKRNAKTAKRDQQQKMGGEPHPRPPWLSEWRRTHSRQRHGETPPRPCDAPPPQPLMI